MGTNYWEDKETLLSSRLKVYLIYMYVMLTGFQLINRRHVEGLQK